MKYILFLILLTLLSCSRRFLSTDLIKQVGVDCHSKYLVIQDTYLKYCMIKSDNLDFCLEYTLLKIQSETYTCISQRLGKIIEEMK